jgi:hypothetical protein
MPKAPPLSFPRKIRFGFGALGGVGIRESLADSAKLANMKLGDNQHAKEGSSLELPSISQAEAAAALDVGVATVKRAKAVLDSADPDLISSVERGECPTSFQREGFHPMFFPKPKPADKLNHQQIIERFRSHLRDEIDLALDGRIDRAVLRDIERELREQSQLLALQRSMS